MFLDHLLVQFRFHMQCTHMHTWRIGHCNTFVLLKVKERCVDKNVVNEKFAYVIKKKFKSISNENIFFARRFGLQVLSLLMFWLFWVVALFFITSNVMLALKCCFFWLSSFYYFVRCPQEWRGFCDVLCGTKILHLRNYFFFNGVRHNERGRVIC